MALIQTKSSDIRKCKDGLLFEYLKYAEGQESPEAFHIWTALSLVAASIGRNGYLERGYGNIYPNLFIVLVGESAVVHKSTAIKMGTRLLRRAHEDGINYFSQKITPEAMIGFLAGIYEATGASEAFIESSEFATTLGKSRLDDSLLKMLTDLWDCPDYWSYTTRSMGEEKCNKVCLNLIAGSTPEWLKNSLPEESLGGGFFSRLILVFRDEPGPPNPHPEDGMSPATKLAMQNVIHDLKIINGLKGEFQWEPTAKDMFADWYCNYNQSKIAEAPSFMRGYYGRKPDFLIKVAMLTSLSLGNTLIITKENFMFARSLLEDNETYIKEVTDFMGQSIVGKEIGAVKEKIKKAGRIEHSKLVRNCSGQFNAQRVREILNGLIEGKLIEKYTAEPMQKGKKGKIYYEYTGGED